MMASHLHERWEPMRFWGTLVTLYLGTSGAVWCRLKFSLDSGEKQTRAAWPLPVTVRGSFLQGLGKEMFLLPGHPGTADVLLFFSKAQ